MGVGRLLPPKSNGVQEMVMNKVQPKNGVSHNTPLHTHRPDRKLNSVSLGMRHDIQSVTQKNDMETPLAPTYCDEIVYE